MKKGKEKKRKGKEEKRKKGPETKKKNNIAAMQPLRLLLEEKKGKGEKKRGEEKKDEDGHSVVRLLLPHLGAQS